LANCPIHLEQGQPLLTGCPGDDEFIFFLGVSPSLAPDGFGFRKWSTIKDCLFTALLGPGIVVFNGSQLNGSNQFAVSALDGFKELLFYCGLNRFLNYDSNNPTYPTSEWKPLSGGGVQILIPATFTSADIFLIFPNGQS
jgi:hypothetical protein